MSPTKGWGLSAPWKVLGVWPAGLVLHPWGQGKQESTQGCGDSGSATTVSEKVGNPTQETSSHTTKKALEKCFLSE